MPWFFSGTRGCACRWRRNTAFSTAGAATADGRLADAAPEAARRHDDRLDLRHLVHAHRRCRCRSSSARCGRPSRCIRRRAPPTGRRRTSLRPALDLLRVDRMARIGGGDDAVHLSLPSSVTETSAHAGDVAAEAHRSARGRGYTPCGARLAPAGSLGHRVQHGQMLRDAWPSACARNASGSWPAACASSSMKHSR